MDLGHDRQIYTINVAASATRLYILVSYIHIIDFTSLYYTLCINIIMQHVYKSAKLIKLIPGYIQRLWSGRCSDREVFCILHIMWIWVTDLWQYMTKGGRVQRWVHLQFTTSVELDRITMLAFWALLEMRLDILLAHGRDWRTFKRWCGYVVVLLFSTVEGTSH